ncbi:MAG: TIGR03118 family protein [Acidobacteriaceae bacterium]|nr:TIGR03118 family protein [Acidobacteriaceae bacterium]
MILKQHASGLAGIAFAAVLVVSPSALFATSLSQTNLDQTNLVSSVPGLAATTDPNLVDPWGVAFSSTGPFWMANPNSATATIYDGAGNLIKIGGNPAITVPGGASGTAGPTGEVFNGTSGFQLNGSPAHFLFANLNGSISGWTGGASTLVAPSTITPGATFTGLALAGNAGSNYLYAADSTYLTGKIDVFNSSFQPVALGTGTFAGKFVDPNAQSGFVPFNIQLIGGQLYVAYANLNPDGSSNPGGYVDIYSTNGTFVKRFASGGALDAPWGFAMAPAGFGSFGGDLLVANNGNGWINAFNATTGAFVGSLDGANGQPLAYQDLWTIEFRTGGANVNTNALYFVEGINNDTGGLFGELTTSTPEPASLALIGLGVLGVGLFARRKKVVRS